MVYLKVLPPNWIWQDRKALLHGTRLVSVNLKCPLVLESMCVLTTFKAKRIG